MPETGRALGSSAETPPGMVPRDFFLYGLTTPARYGYTLAFTRNAKCPCCSRNCMPKQKQKTHKGLAKRVKVSARGKIKHRKGGASHLTSVKSAKRLRRIRRRATVTSNTFAKKILVALHS